MSVSHSKNKHDSAVTIMQHSDVAIDVQQGSQQNSGFSKYTAACKWLYSESSGSRGVITSSGGDIVEQPRVPGSSPSQRWNLEGVLVAEKGATPLTKYR